MSKMLNNFSEKCPARYTNIAHEFYGRKINDLYSDCMDCMYFISQDKIENLVLETNNYCLKSIL